MTSPTRRSRPASAWLVPAALVAVCAFASRADAAFTICVNPAGTGSCTDTIQGAVDLSPPNAVILVAAGTYFESVVIAGKALVVRGAGAGTTIVDGGGGGRVFDVQGQGTRVTLEDLTVRNGGGGEGAGVRCGPTTRVTLERVTISDCHAPGASNGGGVLVAPGARLTVLESTIEDNSANLGGGIVGEECPAIVAGCASIRIALTDSILRSNTATEGSAIRTRGRLDLFGTEISQNLGGVAVRVLKGPLRMTGSSISTNAAGGLRFEGSARLASCTVADNGGTGIFADDARSFRIERCAITGNHGVDGGGLELVGRAGEVKTSTISGNDAASGAGIYSKMKRMRVSSSTIAFNVATVAGGGIECDSSDPRLRCPDLEATILGDNAAPTGPDCHGGTYRSKGYLLVESAAGCTIDEGIGDRTGVDPLLGPLQDNGGSTLTHEVLPGSQAIRRIPLKRLCRPDQRGFERTVLCDIGAFEAP
jgi:fibronectin-binding autotransporter adhesin